MKTRIVHTKIWQDEWFCSISRISGWIYLYLLSCPENNICGVFELPDRVICFNARVNQSELDKAKEDLKSKVCFYNGWVKILNSTKYNNYVTNDKLQVALQKELSLIPQEIREYIDKYDTSIDTSIHTTNNHKSKIINQKEGGVGETKGIDSLTDEFCQKLAQHYEAPLSFVVKKKNDLVLYCKANGKNYKDYQAALQSWVRKDLDAKTR